MLISAAITIACMNPLSEFTLPKSDPDCYTVTTTEQVITTYDPRWLEMLAIPTGTPLVNNGGDECVALVNHYLENLIGYPHIPIYSAYQLWTMYDYLPEMNQNLYRSATPVTGSVVVMAGGGYNPVHGHTGLVTAVHADGTFSTMEQNTETNRYTAHYVRDMTGVSGFLVPKSNIATPKVEKKITRNKVPYTRVYEH